MPVLSSIEKQVLKSFVEYLNRLHLGEINKTVLYGSRARGGHHLALLNTGSGREITF